MKSKLKIQSGLFESEELTTKDAKYTKRKPERLDTNFTNWREGEFQSVRIRVIRVERLARVRKVVSPLRFATAFQDAGARIYAKVDLKVFHRRFRYADFAVNNLRLQDGKQ